MMDEVVAGSSNEQQSAVAAEMKTIAILGDVLLAARKAKSFTQQDVSNTLRISVKQIEALETNSFNELPEAMITRGFIRNYARLLEVDAEPLLASYRAQVPDKSPNALSVQTSMHQVVSNKQDQSWAKYIIASIFVLLCLFAWLFYMNFMAKSVKLSEAPSVHEVAVTPTVSSVETQLPELALPAAERQLDAADSATASSDQTNANPVPGEIDSIQTISTQEKLKQEAFKQEAEEAETTKFKSMPPKTPSATQPQSTAVDFHTLKANAVRVTDQAAAVSVAPQAPSVASVANSTNALNTTKVIPLAKIDAKLNVESNVKDTATITKKVSVTVTERSWVSVANKSGKVLFEKTLAAGSEEVFDGTPPLNVVIGNAQATKLIFSGKSVDLADVTKNNVARITLE